ncbi:ABC transporter substrate-binding protein [Leptolyngbya sp. NK1-12]|uniref:ABC transporter substrate-binding protein n=1 Tax=Leptolyngbya sp. NK1-12 TaxID=2547451 RepID=UPI00292F6492|nr:ABC transporter substrate-binding protein [Leptolyngbya sp. NK1-12]
MQAGVGTSLAAVLHSCTQSSQPSTGDSLSSAEPPIKIRVGFWPITAGLPLYFGVNQGLFKAAGLEVEAVKFASAQQVAEAGIAGRIEGTVALATGALGLAEIASPGLFKIIATNVSNVDMIFDEFIVEKDAPFQSIADLRGKRVSCSPGPQNVAIAKGILRKNGIEYPQVEPLDIKQHIAAIEAKQVDAIFTLEPTGTIGRLKGITRVLESGVISKYLLGDPKALWHGGSVSLTSQFLKTHPQTAKKYIGVVTQAIETVRNQPDVVRPALEEYTAVKGDLSREVPLTGFKLYSEFSETDLKDFQTYFDFIHAEKILSKRIEVAPLIYKDA